MRLLKDHLVDKDTSEQLEIAAMDEPGEGGANHHYLISHPSANFTEIYFQNGPIKERGINGVTNEALLAVVIDRLRSFQNGPFPSTENSQALNHVELALDWLKKRTKDRIERGVEGVNAK